MITTLSTGLTTPVPPPLAERFNLRPGAQLDWQADDEGFVIHVKVAPLKRSEMIGRLHELGAKHRRADADPVADLVRERVEDEDLRNRALPSLCPASSHAARKGVRRRPQRNVASPQDSSR